MKNYAFMLALSGLLILSACSEQKAPMEAEEPGTPSDEELVDAVKLDNTSERLSYGIAYGMGTRMIADGMPMSVPAFTAGIQDAFEGKESRMTQQEITEEIQAFNSKKQVALEAASAQAADANATASAAFLSDNAGREGVVVLSSGLQYQIITEGTGARPGLADTVEVHYRGTLIDGTQFDSSYDRDATVSFGVTQVIAGWTEALQLMSAGSTWKLFIPAELAYGSGGAGDSIGPNAALVFDVELVSIAPGEG